MQKININVAVLCLVVLCIREGNAQTRANLLVKVGLSGVSIKEIPSYIQVNGSYLLMSEGIDVESQPAIASSLGLEVQKQVFTSCNLYSGLHLNYRRTHLNYHNNNLFFYDRGVPATKHTFSVDMNYEYLMVQLPIGMMIPVRPKFYLDLAIINGLVIKVWKQRTASHEVFKYQLVSLENRTTNPLVFEFAIGAAFQTNDYKLRVDFTHGVNTVESKTDNAYNDQIPADLYFTGINLTMQARLQVLHFFHKE